MAAQITLGDMVVEVVQKDIKNVHLSVYPPDGKVRISAPSMMSLDTIRVHAISKLPWIRQQQKKLKEQARETRREFLDRESHYLWGKRYLLTVVEANQRPGVELKPRQMVLVVRPGADEEKRRLVMENWYRDQVKIAVLPLIAHWEPLVGVKVKRFFVQKMKTRWGSCNPDKGNIRLNTELVKKPPECLEYILVHEMVHLLVRHHDGRFLALMDRLLPNWKHIRNQLNATPLTHEKWAY